MVLFDVNVLVYAHREDATDHIAYRLPGIRGNLVPDAYFAALALESGCEWLTADRGFARFPGLRWRHPLA